MVTVISPGLGMTTPVMVLVPVNVEAVGNVILVAYAVSVFVVTVVTSPPWVGKIVKKGKVVTVPFAVIVDWSVVGSALRVDTKVVANDEVLVTSDVATVEMTEVKMMVEMRMVKYEVNLETEVVTGINTAPLGRTVILMALELVSVSEGTDVAVVLLETRDVELETDTVEDDTDDPELEVDEALLLLVSARRFTPPLNVRLVSSIDDAVVVPLRDVKDRVVDSEREEEEGVEVATSVVDKVVDPTRVVDKVVDSARVVDSVVDSTKLVDTIVVFVVAASITSDVFVTARASRTGCVAFGWRPRILTLLSESGILTSATTTSTMATSRRAMTAPMKGHRSGVGL